MTALLDLAAIYRTATDQAPWEDAETLPQEGRALVRQYDETVSRAAGDLGSALATGDLEAARAVERGLRAVLGAFGGAEWVMTT